MLNHTKLNVYQKALSLAAEAESISHLWGARHAIVDHYCRAAESIALNIADGARRSRLQEKSQLLDCALGSTLECAACLDLAAIKCLVTTEQLQPEKARFLQVAKMLVALRRSWKQKTFCEDQTGYRANEMSGIPGDRFHHEYLDVYQVAVDFVRWFVAQPGGADLSNRLCREVDKSATSVVLNIAEGNGRYAFRDHRRFLEIAMTSAVKAATYLELYQRKVAPAAEITAGMELLGRLVTILSRF
jgi:four helix bundle protein